MVANAIAKITAEMNSSNNNPYVNVVGNFLIKHLELNKQDDSHIMDEDKTILKSLEEMRKEAEKKKVGNYAVLTDEEGFSIVLKYFGIDGQVTKNREVDQVTTSAPTIIKKQSKTDFNVSLDDFL